MWRAGSDFFVRFTFQMEFGVIVTAIFTTALAYPLLVWGQRHTTATNTALILTCEPVFAAMTSFIVLHERLGGRALGGAAAYPRWDLRRGMEGLNSRRGFVNFREMAELRVSRASHGSCGDALFAFLSGFGGMRLRSY